MIKGSAPSSPSETLLSQSLESFQKVNVGGNTVIISVEDSLAIGEDTAFGSDYSKTSFLSIFAENLVLSGKFKAKKGVLSLHRLTTVNEGLLNYAGHPGSSPETVNEDPNSSGDAGGEGDPGGKLLLYIEQSDPGAPVFKIAAGGGRGGEGQQGTDLTSGGRGGGGGNGGHVLIAAGSPYLGWLSQLKETTALHELGAKQAKLKELIGALPDDPGLRALALTLNDAVSAVSEETFTQSVENAALILQAQGTGFESSLFPAVDVSGGAYGVHGDGKSNGGNGLPGDPGSLSTILFGAPQELAALNVQDHLPQLPKGDLQAYFIIHPSQCKRLLEKIKLMYWSLDPVSNPRGVGDLMTLLLRLQARTETFVRADDDSPLIDYYNNNEAAIGAIDSVGQLRAIHDETTRYLQQLKQGQDVYGYDSNYVPLGSFMFYKKILDELIDNFGQLESDYSAYFSALENNTAQINDIQSARDKQQSMVAAAESQLTSLRSIAVKTARIIDGYQTELTPLKNILDEKMDKLRGQINEHHFDFNFDLMFQSLTSLAFAPESQFMILTQASQFLYQGTTNVTDDKGEPVRKEYLLSQLKAVKADIDNLQEGFSALDNGTLAPDDPGAAKLIAEEQQVMQFFNDFYSQFPKSLDELKTAFQNYINKVEERNNQILAYNATVFLIFKNRGLIDAAQDRTAVLNEQSLDTMAPNLPDVVNLISSMYYATRNQVMETLDLTSRAFRFWSLSDKNLVGEAYAGKTLPELNHSALLGAKNSILREYQQAVENFGTNHAQFPPRPDQRGKMLEVPAEQVELFRDLNQLMIRIPVDDQTFAGMANVRLQTVRVWIDGANVNSDDKTITIRITHTGREQIVNTREDIFNFTHEPVNKTFIYHTVTKEIMEEANFGVEQAISGSTTDYAALGPFTTWHISVDPDVNPHADLSQVSRIGIEFHGTNYTFDR